jgi:excisionase family DNA binding protein
MRIRDLATHPMRYVTIAELAEYWAVSPQQIYKRIDSGALEAIQLGSRLYRVRTTAALEYERCVRVAPDYAAEQRADRLPRTIRVQQRVLKSNIRLTTADDIETF